jgi:hypothetical protein
MEVGNRNDLGEVTATSQNCNPEECLGTLQSNAAYVRHADGVLFINEMKPQPAGV